MKMFKRIIGILLAILFLVLFDLVAGIIQNNFDGAPGYVAKSIQRIVFFAVELIIFVKLYRKESIRSVINMEGFRKAVPAYIAMLLYIVFDVLTYAIIGAKIWLNTTVPIVVSCLFLMQLATGLWEELTFRAFVCEGYYQDGQPTFKSRLIYAIISMIVFGAVHSIECDSMEQAVYRFIMTGV
jgi:hypothetical protein